MAAIDGDYELLGVAGTGAPVRMDFIAPGGASTGKLLPTGNVVDTLERARRRQVEASMVDAGNPLCAVDADAHRPRAASSCPMEIDATAMLETFEKIRCVAGVAMGISTTVEASPRQSAEPAQGRDDRPAAGRDGRCGKARRRVGGRPDGPHDLDRQLPPRRCR